MTKIEKIQGLLEDVESDVRKSTINDILDDLREFLKNCPAAERVGMEAAVEIIDSNYIH